MSSNKERTCNRCGSSLVVRPVNPGIRTRWYECPECDEVRNPSGSYNTNPDQ